jgi:aryl-alcohol dehydrogenase-like predicted oxidoreductase
MLERYVEMSLARDPGFAHMPPEQADAAREMARATKVAEPSYALVQRQCEREVGRSEYRCAVAAKSPEEWEACID